MTTTPTRAQMREDLARALGCQLENIAADVSEPLWVVRAKPNHLQLDALSSAVSGENCYFALPDPFTSAEDNRALVAWLAEDDARWAAFYAWFVVDGLGLHPGSDDPVAVVRDVMTAPLPVIAEAAWQAIQEQPS